MASEGRKSFFLLVLALLSRVMGLMRTLVLAFIYGAGAESDLINFGFSFPNQARKGLQEGLGNVSLLSHLHHDREYAQQCISKVMGIHLVAFFVLIPLALPIGWILMSFSSLDGSYRTLGILFMPLYMVFLVFFSLSQSLSAVLQDAGHYVRAQALPLIFSLIVLVSLFVFGRSSLWTFPIAVASASAIYLASTLATLKLSGLKVSFSIRNDRAFTVSYLKGMLLFALYLALNMVYYISSGRKSGMATYFTNAHTLVLIPYSIVLTTFTGYHYPKIATVQEKGRRLIFVDQAIRQMLCLMLPVVLLFFTFSKEISIFIFENGAYTRADALATSRLVDILLFGVFFLLGLSVLERLSFLESKERTVYFTMALAIALSVLALLGFDEYAMLPAFMFTFSNVLATAVLLFSSHLISPRRLKKALTECLLVSSPLIVLAATYRGFKVNMFDYVDGKLAVAAICLTIASVPTVVSLVIWYLRRN